MGELSAVICSALFVSKGGWKLSSLPFSSNLHLTTTQKAAFPSHCQAVTEECSSVLVNVFPLCFWNGTEQAFEVKIRSNYNRELEKGTINSVL